MLHKKLYLPDCYEDTAAHLPLLSTGSSELGILEDDQNGKQAPNTIPICFSTTPQQYPGGWSTSRAQATKNIKLPVILVKTLGIIDFD